VSSAPHPRVTTTASSRKISWGVALAGIALLIARKPWALTTPQLWAEDGVVHLLENEQPGLQALLTPHRGYLHTLPRIVAWLASHTLDVAHWPAFYNGAALLVTFLLLLRLASPRCDLPGKNWLVLSFALTAHTGDVFFNITNLHWITGFFLLLQTLLPRPTSWAQRLGDLTLVFLVGLTGPFVILFLPLFAWRLLRERNADTLAALLAAGACAAIQAYFVKTTGGAYFAQSPEPFSLAKMLTITGSRLAVWPLFGTHVASTLSWTALRVIGMGFIALLLVWALRPHPRRWLRAHLVVAFVLFTTTVLYRIRADTWSQPDLVNADSYFFVPRLLLAWLLIWELDARPPAVAWVARGLCVVAVMLQLPDYVKPAAKDLQWKKTCDPIRRGAPAKIPILPEGWHIHYPGRPAQILPASAAASYRPALPNVAGDVRDNFFHRVKFLPSARCSRPRQSALGPRGTAPAGRPAQSCSARFPRRTACVSLSVAIHASRATICSSSSSPPANGSTRVQSIPARSGNCSNFRCPTLGRVSRSCWSLSTVRRRPSAGSLSANRLLNLKATVERDS